MTDLTLDRPSAERLAERIGARRPAANASASAGATEDDLAGLLADLEWPSDADRLLAAVPRPGAP